MDKLATFALGLLLFGAVFFAAPILGVLGGAFSGWVLTVVGFEPLIVGFMGRLGVNIDGLPLWHVGAAMGFLGGFLKTSVSQSSKS